MINASRNVTKNMVCELQIVTKLCHKTENIDTKSCHNAKTPIAYALNFKHIV